MGKTLANNVYVIKHPKGAKLYILTVRHKLIK